MEAAGTDPGDFFQREIMLGECFANAFACNDPASLALLWGAIEDGPAAPVVILNARRDRPLRTRSFAAFLAAQLPRPLVFVTGDPLAGRFARAAGLSPEAVRRLRAAGSGASATSRASARGWLRS